MTDSASLGGGDATNEGVERIMDFEVPVVVRFGSIEMTLDEVSRLAPGSLVDLDRHPDEPAELLVNKRVFATGQIVAVDGNYALRITEILAPDDRIRSLGA